MLVIGLAGLQGVGKDEVANYLVRRYGFIKFAFSDALYAEVQAAFGLADQSLLRDRETKDTPQDRLVLKWCTDEEFVKVATAEVDTENTLAGYDVYQVPDALTEPLSPRQILQWYGTEYRRAQDENYWLKKAGEFIYKTHTAPRYPEHRPTLYVEAGTRFENERQFIHKLNGNIWHIHRDGILDTTGHVSAKPLEVWPNERQLWNNSTIQDLWQGIDLLLSQPVEFVRMEPLIEGKSVADLQEEAAMGSEPGPGT